MTVVLVFLGGVTGTMVTQPGEVADAGWFTLEEAQALSLACTHNEIVKLYAER
jgi:hypothetical protein